MIMGKKNNLCSLEVKVVTEVSVHLLVASAQVRWCVHTARHSFPPCNLDLCEVCAQVRGWLLPSGLMLAFPCTPALCLGSVQFSHQS